MSTPDRRIWWFALGYCVSYIPYAALIKATSDGLVSSGRGRIIALEILPAVIAGYALVMPLIITTLGWWKYAAHRRIAGVEVPWPGRHTALSGTCFATIVFTTALAYTFREVSIVLALLLMRGGVVALAPVVDMVGRRKVHWYSWAACALSLAAVIAGLSSVDSYEMPVGVAMNLTAYLAAYAIRLRTMTTLAKTHDETSSRRYFVEETLVTLMVLVAMAAGLWGMAGGEGPTVLQKGFPDLVGRTILIPALLTGAAYACLAFFGTGIYLDWRENTFAVPLNRASSLIAGVIASLLLTVLAGAEPLDGRQLVGVGLMLLVVVVLTAPDWRPRPLAAPAAVRAAQRLFVFVCSGNTSRSPMAQAICTAEIARRLGMAAQEPGHPPVQVLSAGITAVAGAPMTEGARHALNALSVPVPHHAARNLTADDAERAEAMYCMTSAQREMLVARFPAAERKIHCLQPDADLEDPSGQGPDVYLNLARRLQELIGRRLDELGIAQASPAV